MGKERGKETSCVVTSHAPPTGGLARNPGMCPDWESNRRPFGSQGGTQSTEPHQAGHAIDFLRDHLHITFNTVYCYDCSAFFFFFMAQ